jgi:site-specific DNA-adenine methylase
VGSKRTDIKYYESFMPDALTIDICIEPYGGSGYNSLYLFSKNKNIKSIINDTDELLINFFTQIKNNTDTIIDGFNNLIIAYHSKEEFKNILTEFKENKSNNTRRAILYLFLNKFHGIKKFMYPLNKKINIINKEKYAIFFEWLKNTEFNLKDYTDTFKDIINYDINKKYFIFLDPPYLDSCNRFYNSHNNCVSNYDNTTMYIDIKNYFKLTQKNTMLIINKNSITYYLYKKYLKGEYKKIYQYTKNTAIHLIITNYGGVI